MRRRLPSYPYALACVHGHFTTGAGRYPIDVGTRASFGCGMCLDNGHFARFEYLWYVPLMSTPEEAKAFAVLFAANSGK